jgi:hypothetical protein
MGVLAAAARLRQKDFASRRTWIVYDMTKWMIAVYVGSWASKFITFGV